MDEEGGGAGEPAAYLQVDSNAWPGWKSNTHFTGACGVEQRIGVLEGAHSALQSLYSEQLMALPSKERAQVGLLVGHAA